MPSARPNPPLDLDRDFEIRPSHVEAPTTSWVEANFDVGLGESTVKQCVSELAVVDGYFSDGFMGVAGSVVGARTGAVTGAAIIVASPDATTMLAPQIA